MISRSVRPGEELTKPMIRSFSVCTMPLSAVYRFQTSRGTVGFSAQAAPAAVRPMRISLLRSCRSAYVGNTAFRW